MPHHDTDGRQPSLPARTGSPERDDGRRSASRWPLLAAVGQLADVHASKRREDAEREVRQRRLKLGTVER
ncbi:MAG: hypothetical protein H6733_11550 [Alphaproteobacteria bacterium]|nr:hypothetical protein [Alphaproteobacteria bacterium]